MLIPSTHLPETAHQYLCRTNTLIKLIYFLIVSIVIVLIGLMPFVYIDVTVAAPGMVRPASERTAVKSSVAGFLHTLNYEDGEFIQKDSVVAYLKSDAINQKKLEVEGELKELGYNIQDLELLVRYKDTERIKPGALQTGIYQQQFVSFLNRRSEQKLVLSKTEEEIRINRFLAQEKVISAKDLFDKENEMARSETALNQMKAAQLALWQQELDRLRSIKEKLAAEKSRLAIDALALEIRAPVSGSVQYPVQRYPGNFIEPGETLCNISPEENLVAECLVSSRDIALIKSTGKVLFNVDAFSHNYFGLLSGEILSIDKDITVIDNKPVFKVRCSFDKQELSLRNGFKGRIQKGLTVQANFILTRRSLWHLFFDTVEDWLNPHNRKPYL
jgi:membrane fusion protein, peptide pheromone/bacteriocin exporter